MRFRDMLSRDMPRLNARRLFARLRGVLRRRQVEAELDDELEFHLQMQARKHQAAGASAVDALACARREFGNVQLVKEDARDVRGTRAIDEIGADVRYGARGLRRSPVFSLAVILTIGLGVGLNTSVFTIFDAYVLRPFDVRDPHSLYSLQWLDRSGHMRDFTQRDLDGLTPPSAIAADVAGYRTFAARIGATPAVGDAVTPNYFRMAGVRPALGRALIPSDAYLPVVVLGYGLWQRAFGADSNVVGRTISILGSAFRVVGVAQAGFEGFFKKPRDFWLPIATMPRPGTASVAPAGADDPVSALVRLAPRVSASQGKAFFASALLTSTAALPDSARFMRVFLTSRATAITPSAQAYLTFAPLIFAFGLILFLACANVANMLLARGTVRRREFATRLALGADRARLVRQLVTEAVVLALPAVAVGFAIAWLVVGLGVRALYATLPADLTAFVRLVPLHSDWRVLGFAFLVSVGAAFVFGLLPARHATRLSLVDAIRGEFGGKASTRMRGGLIVGQITAASLLLSIAGVLVRETARLAHTETGLRTRDAVSIEVQDRARPAVLAVLGASHTVDAIASAAALPLDMRYATAVVVAPDSTRVTILYNRVTAGYFDLLKIGLVGGRTFTSQEENVAAPSVIISESAARRLWRGGSPLGRIARFEVRAASNDPIVHYQNATVVGVVQDVVVHSIEDGRERPVFYFPQSREASGCCILARVRGEPSSAKRALDGELERAAPGSVDRIDLLDTYVTGAIYPYRVAYCIALGLGLVALGLTVIGVYGVVGYLVSQRAREIGIRIALGARTTDVLALIMSQSIRQALVGTTIGAVFAVGAVRALASNIHGMPAFDAIAFITAFSTVVVSCVIAALVPSRRAAQVDATVALRQD